MRTRRTRGLALTPLTSLTALALAAGCSGAADSPEADATTTTSTTAASTGTSTPASPSSTGAAAPGSPGPTAGVPDGAGSATTVDLDGDGRPDTVWLAGDAEGHRNLGVTTTSHGTVFTGFTSAAPQTASASAAVLASGAPVVLLDTGRSVELYVYRVEGPSLGPVRGVEGDPYSFSLGFTPYGTGLTCEAQGDGLHLYGENAVADGDAFTVTRTEVHVSAEHSVAQNGEQTTVGTGLSADDPVVKAAHGTTCGDGGVAHEPR
ncbi:hypothetical protein AB2L27_01270 [Kineococcus sp. LSe6-4]|uniref:VCBS repeat-containing protein n=1 Tax=Kineococcus halophytocola TaxID=3234027 RepID=A0ABV4GWD5_9ACTN